MSTITAVLLFAIPVAFIEIVLIAFLISGITVYRKHKRINRHRG